MSRALLLPLGLLLACNPDEDSLLDDTDLQDGPDLAERVTVEGLLGHLDALQAIAAEHDGHRASLSSGYDASVDYVASTLEDAGYTVTLEPYEFTAYALVGAALSQVAPVATDYTEESPQDDGFTVLQYSPSGDVTATVVAVDVDIPPATTANRSDSGCEAADFTGFPAGAIALVQRGTCTFSTKAGYAEAAGAVAVVVFNEGQTGRTEPVQGVLDENAVGNIPVVGISYALGAELAAASGTAQLHVVVDATYATDTEYNVVAETPGGDPSRVVVVGAHLDSVAEGPGINDNGSGTALVLETAVQAVRSGWAPVNKVRFAFWGAEEEGLIGSWHHVHDEQTQELDPATTGPIIAYLNYDMVASGNGFRFVYDGDGSDFGQGATAASAEIEAIYLDFYADRGQDVGAEGLVIPSDSYWFVAAGIPTGGLFSGAFDPLTEAQAASVGGETGEDHDPCYHRACDRVENIDPELFADLAAGGVHAVQVLGERADPLPESRRAQRTDDWPRPYGDHAHLRWDR